MKKVCSIPECGNDFLARGLCKLHYYRWKRQGNPLIVIAKNNTEEDFWSKVEIGEDNECWLWQTGKDDDGYGAFWWNNRQVKAHRFSWEIFNGPIRDGLQVLHDCDTPSCVNPCHLFLGTTQDNTADRYSKGRQARGVSCHSTVLSEQDVAKARSMSLGKVSGRKIARLLGVHPSTIYKLLN